MNHLHAAWVSYNVSKMKTDHHMKLPALLLLDSSELTPWKFHIQDVPVYPREELLREISEI